MGQRARNPTSLKAGLPGVENPKNETEIKKTI